MRPLCRNMGYTLTELLIVVAILAVLAALAVPNLLGPRDAAQLRGAVNNLKGDLNLARMMAVKTNVPTVVQFHSDRYEIYSDSNLNWQWDPGERRISNPSLPPGVRIDLTATDFDQDRTRFNTRGMPDNLGNVGLGSVIVANTRGDQQRLQLNRLGRIRID